MSSPKGGTINKQILKTRTGEFDIESIHSVTLRDLGISSLGCIGECSALERLDLTNNDISKLYPLASLTNLTHLSLSRNRISSLEGLQSLDNLESLNLAGNLISNVDGLYVLANLDNLKELRLRDTIHELSNPICMNLGYKQQVLTILPNLTVLDGERLHGKGSELFKLCDQIDAMVEEKTRLSNMGNAVSTGHQGEWLPAGFFEHKQSKAFDEGLLGDAQQQLEDMIADCKRISNNVENVLAEAKPPS